jgi:hypothetical protein
MTTPDPTVLFLLWNAFEVESSALIFDVTRANVPRIGRPDSLWLAAACRTLGVTGRTGDYSAIAMRSSYFSDYADAKAAEDRWPDCWTVKVEVRGELSIDHRCGGRPLLLAELDPSWDGARDPAHDECALIFAVGDARAAEDVLESASARAASVGLRPRPTAPIRCADGRACVRMLTACAFPDDVDALEAVTQQLSRARWATNWRQALG